MLKFSTISFSLLILISSTISAQNADTDWPIYLGDYESSQYSDLDQITPENVDQLEIAWVFDAGSYPSESRSILECNPLIIDGVLYGTSARKMLFALNAETGEPKWRFDPYVARYGNKGVSARRSGANRGIAYWSDSSRSRIFYSSENWLFAIDPSTGKLIESFGTDGHIDLKKGLGRNIDSLSYTSQSPGVVFGNLIILPSTVSESLPAAPGHIRAFNVITGAQVWKFNTIPEPGEFGYDTWPPEAYKTFGGANAWTGMSLDIERGLVYCPTGSATFDFYGGDRIGQNLFANTLLCLDARSGQRVWHYQLIHHDVHDFDLPAPPNLFTMKRDGEEIPAVAQLTKTGHVFVFNRVTGEPLYPIEERSVPLSEVPGEQSWPTQPRPTKPAPFVREQMTIEDITDISPESHQEILAKYQSILPHVPFRPPSEKRDTIILPGMWGGAEWGGGALDPNGVLYFNSNEIPAIVTLIDSSSSGSIGKDVYTQNCIACHGVDLKGGTAFGQVVPTLVDISKRKQSSEIEALLRQGSASMPPFRHLTLSQMYHLLDYLDTPEQVSDHEADNVSSGEKETRFIHTGNRMWLDSKGYPAIKPPWGTLNAIDLNTGEYLWKSVFGEYPELLEKGVAPTGRLSWGGPVATGGGVLFIGANLDGYLRGYDMKTGKELWRDRPPAGGYATPSVYAVDGKQYLVIACGGGRGTPEADLYIAYALP